jgi:hypothetical protein
MLTGLHRNRRAQIALGLFIGIAFGFLLQKSNVTSYQVVIGQLLLSDFTILKMMLSAVIVGMIGFFTLKRLRLVQPHIMSGAAGSSLAGGLVFGLGFALLGYCPGTVAGAVGQGALDALFGGCTGMLIGAGLFARIYPALDTAILHRGEFPATTLPQLLHASERLVILLFVIVSVLFLLLLEHWGL